MNVRANEFPFFRRHQTSAHDADSGAKVFNINQAQDELRNRAGEFGGLLLRLSQQSPKSFVRRTVGLHHRRFGAYRDETTGFIKSRKSSLTNIPVRTVEHGFRTTIIQPTEEKVEGSVFQKGWMLGVPLGATYHEGLDDVEGQALEVGNVVKIWRTAREKMSADMAMRLVYTADRDSGDLTSYTRGVVDQLDENERNIASAHAVDLVRFAIAHLE